MSGVVIQPTMDAPADGATASRPGRRRTTTMWGMLRRTFEEWKEDQCPSVAASLSYYTTFSLAPLLLLVLLLVGLFLDPSDVEGRLASEISRLVGPEAAEQVRSMVRSVDRPASGGPLLTVLSIAGLVFGATGAFNELQSALNRVWEVQPDPEAGLLAKVGKRVLSLGMVMTVAFLLLVSLVVSALVSAAGDRLTGWMPDGVSEALLQLLNSGLSLLVIAVLFSLIFKVMPDARIGWRDVAVGAAATALLFVGGKFAVGEYVARSDPGEVFGAAGSLAVILVWIYYSAMILLFGAEFTQVWATERGSGIEPDEGAVRLIEVTR